MAVDKPFVAVEGCRLMFAVLRSLAPAVLLLAWLTGHAATGVVVAHVASSHAVTSGRNGDLAAEHHAADHHAADHRAAEHSPRAEGERRDADHDSEHAHQFMPASTVATARIACPSIDSKPFLAAMRQGRFDRPDSHALTSLVWPVLRAGPLEPQRHSILLL